MVKLSSKRFPLSKHHSYCYLFDALTLILVKLRIIALLALPVRSPVDKSGPSLARQFDLQ